MPEHGNDSGPSLTNGLGQRRRLWPTKADTVRGNTAVEWLQNQRSVGTPTWEDAALVLLVQTKMLSVHLKLVTATHRVRMLSA